MRIRSRSNDAHLPQLLALVEAGSGLLEPRGQDAAGGAEDRMLRLRPLRTGDPFVSEALLRRAVVADVVGTVGRLDDGDGSRPLRRGADPFDDFFRQCVLNSVTGN